MLVKPAPYSNEKLTVASVPCKKTPPGRHKSSGNSGTAVPERFTGGTLMGRMRELMRHSVRPHLQSKHAMLF